MRNDAAGSARRGAAKIPMIISLAQGNTVTEGSWLNVELYDKRDQGFIEVWLTNAEQEQVDRAALAKQLLAEAGRPRKCKVVYFLSSSADLTRGMSGLLRKNLWHRFVCFADCILKADIVK